MENKITVERFPRATMTGTNGESGGEDSFEIIETNMELTYPIGVSYSAAGIAGIRKLGIVVTVNERPADKAERFAGLTATMKGRGFTKQWDMGGTWWQRDAMTTFGHICVSGDCDHEFDPIGQCTAWMQGDGSQEAGEDYFERNFPSLDDLFVWLDSFGNGQIQF